ncbi:MAG TPA: ankyrin repeat domain-containing protein [Acetobacteraceae bacterium]|jgi:hypothetical protein|nr:ankyrin repeat domain-containing protein [Acetobacteraceae bacterium]
MTRDLTCCLALLAGFTLAAPMAAHAQRSAIPSLTGGPVAQPRENAEPPKPAEPPVLPGAQPRTAAVAPAQTPALDMPPTEALFDAINRGDLGAAKDAVNRGADLYGRNILGMTPTDLSVDLGRNDITFLLLSLRPASAGELPPSALASARAPAPNARTTRASATTRAAVASKGPVTPPRTPASLAPRQFAGDGGSPVPQAGFLGFGGAAR